MELQKWTDDDFDQMSWHLGIIHALSLPDEKFNFCFDIDFIIEANQTNQANRIELTVAPCLLCFKSVHNVSINLMTGTNLGIIEITRSNSKKFKEQLFWDYNILLNTGTITFSSSGYLQKMMAMPKTGWSMQYKSRSLSDYQMTF